MMRRDWDVIREILIEIEPLALNDGLDFEVEYDDSLEKELLKGANIKLLLEADYLKGEEIQYLDDDKLQFFSLQLTWKGHELLDTLREQTTWAKIKSISKTKGIAITFESIKILFTAAVTELLSKS